MCDSFAAWQVGAAVALAILAPKEWHDVILDVVRKKYDVGPGGSATEEGETS